MKKEQRSKIIDFLLENVEAHPRDINRLAASTFSVSRTTISKYLKDLVRSRFLVSVGEKKARKYKPRMLIGKGFNLRLSEHPEEDVVWRQRILPLVKDVRENVRTICQYGFTEIYNNAREHSESKTVEISVTGGPSRIWLRIADKGVGIWNKIQNSFHLLDPRHAILELSKGKLTTDPQRHTGEGIFFASRMFDEFSIVSGDLSFIRKKTGEGWRVEVEEKAHGSGTAVHMTIRPNANQTLHEIFDRFASETEDYGFTRTHVPLELLKYEGEELVSRSQARRLLARLEGFREVLLDFRGVGTTGQAFADEIFRVYQKEYPGVRITPINTNPEIEKTIERAKRHAANPDTP